MGVSSLSRFQSGPREIMKELLVSAVEREKASLLSLSPQYGILSDKTTRNYQFSGQFSRDSEFNERMD